MLIECLESRTLLATVASGADLVVVPRDRVSGPYLPGEAARASVVVTNLESAHAASRRTTVVLYLSADNLVDTGDRPVARVTVRALRPGRGAIVRFRFSMPTDLPAGSLAALARVDDADVVDEESEENNVTGLGFGPITLLAPIVDLVPVAVIRARVRLGFKALGTFGTATVLVHNAGNATFSGTPVVTAYATERGVIPPSANLNVLSQEPVTIRPGRSGKVKMSISSSFSTNLTYVLVIQVDAPGDPTPGQAVSAIVRSGRTQ